MWFPIVLKCKRSFREINRKEKGVRQEKYRLDQRWHETKRFLNPLSHENSSTILLLITVELQQTQSHFYQ